MMMMTMVMMVHDDDDDDDDNDVRVSRRKSNSGCVPYNEVEERLWLVPHPPRLKCDGKSKEVE